MKQLVAILALTSVAIALTGCGKSAQEQLAEEQLKAMKQKAEADAEAKAHFEKMYRVPPPADRSKNQGF